MQIAVRGQRGLAMRRRHELQRCRGQAQGLSKDLPHARMRRDKIDGILGAHQAAGTRALFIREDVEQAKCLNRTRTQRPGPDPYGLNPHDTPDRSLNDLFDLEQLDFEQKHLVARDLGALAPTAIGKP